MCHVSAGGMSIVISGGGLFSNCEKYSAHLFNCSSFVDSRFPCSSFIGVCACLNLPVSFLVIL